MSDPRAKPLADDDMQKKILNLVKSCIAAK